MGGKSRGKIGTTFDVTHLSLSSPSPHSGNTDIPTQDGELITGVETLSPKVSVFVAKFTYNPAEMSPNPSYDQELAVTAGDYLYVYGDIDEDGFYRGQHQNGEIGLVPSNFVERVMDESGTLASVVHRRILDDVHVCLNKKPKFGALSKQ